MLVNNGFNTFYLQLYGVRHMITDHSDSKIKPAVAITWATLQLAARDPTDRIAHIMAFLIPVVEHWLEREITQWVHYYFMLFESTYIIG